MAFEKGRKKTGGRKPGSTNKSSVDVRNAFKTLIEDNLESLTNDLKTLDAKSRIDAIIKLSSYVITKPQNEEDPPNDIDFAKLSVEEIKLYLNLLQKARPDSN